MCRFHVVGRVVAHAYMHIVEQQYLIPEIECLFDNVGVPQTLYSWVLQIVTVLTTEKQQHPLHPKHIHFANTLRYLFRASAKTLLSESKLSGRT